MIGKVGESMRAESTCWTSQGYALRHFISCHVAEFVQKACAVRIQRLLAIPVKVSAWCVRWVFQDAPTRFRMFSAQNSLAGTMWVQPG